MHKSGYLAGPALTVRCRPGDNLMIQIGGYESLDGGKEAIALLQGIPNAAELALGTFLEHPFEQMLFILEIIV